MKFIFFEIVKGNLFVVAIYILSFFIEKITGLGLLIWNLRHKQNNNMTHGAANIAMILYFIVNFIVLQVDLELLRNEPPNYSVTLWLLIVLLLSLIFRKIHLKLSNIDPNRDNFDFSD